MNKTNQKRQKYCLAATAAALLLSAPYAAQAKDFTWSGAAGDGLWTSAGNWAPKGVPGAADTAIIGGTDEVSVPGNVTVQNLRLGADASILNNGLLKVTGWTSSDGVVEGIGELTVPPGAAATINLSATKLARNPLRPRLNGAWCPLPNPTPVPKPAPAPTKGKGANAVKFGKVNNKGLLKINIDPSVDVTFDDVSNQGGDAVLNVGGSASDAPIELKGLENQQGTFTLVGTGSGGRAFEGEEISNAGEMIFDGARTLAKNDYSNGKGAKMSLKNDSVLGSSDASKKLVNAGLIEAMDGDAEIQMEWQNNGGHLHVGAGHLRIAPPDGKMATQSSGATTIDDGTLEIDDSVKDPKNSGLQIKGGVLDGSGTIEGNVTIDGGAINVGHSPGLMIINGNFTQTANGLMNMEVWGATPGYLYDQLRVNGNAYLNGTLNIEYGNNYLPGQTSFWHVRYANYVGKFSSVHFVNPLPGRNYRVNYSDMGVYSQVLLTSNPNSTPSFSGIGYQLATPRQYLRAS